MRGVAALSLGPLGAVLDALARFDASWGAWVRITRSARSGLTNATLPNCRCHRCVVPVLVHVYVLVVSSYEMYVRGDTGPPSAGLYALRNTCTTLRWLRLSTAPDSTPSMERTTSTAPTRTMHKSVRPSHLSRSNGASLCSCAYSNRSFRAHAPVMLMSSEL